MSWEEFWAAFESAIHENEDLAEVDKLKYIRGCLEGAVKSVIAGVPMTNAGYDTAGDLLKKRYAQPSVFQCAHINNLMNVTPVFSERHINRSRALHDEIETHFRGLEALGVDQKTYSSIIVPSLMEKIPDNVRISMIRAGKRNHLTWTLDELLKLLELELEVRDSYLAVGKHAAVDNEETRQETSGMRSSPVGTANAMFTNTEKKCGFCLEDHESGNCRKYSDPDERKNILKSMVDILFV